MSFAAPHFDFCFSSEIKVQFSFEMLIWQTLIYHTEGTLALMLRIELILHSIALHWLH